MGNIYRTLSTHHLLAAAAVIVAGAEVDGRRWGDLAEALIDRAGEDVIDLTDEPVEDDVDPQLVPVD